MPVINISNESQFEDVVMHGEGLVMVDFWAPWCGPCKLMSPEIEKLSETLQDGVTIGKVDVDVMKEIALKHGIQGVPTVIFFKDGKELDRIVGYRPAASIETVVQSLLKN